MVTSTLICISCNVILMVLLVFVPGRASIYTDIKILIKIQNLISFLTYQYSKYQPITYLYKSVAHLTGYQLPCQSRTACTFVSYTLLYYLLEYQSDQYLHSVGKLLPVKLLDNISLISVKLTASFHMEYYFSSLFKPKSINVVLNDYGLE